MGRDQGKAAPSQHTKAGRNGEKNGKGKREGRKGRGKGREKIKGK